MKLKVKVPVVHDFPSFLAVSEDYKVVFLDMNPITFVRYFQNCFYKSKT